MTHQWVWELVTDDGHVAYLSQGYTDRDACEDEARLQGVRVVGGRKQLKARAAARPAGPRVYSTGHGLWKWEYIDAHGEQIASSPVAFLTREECERDLDKQIDDIVSVRVDVPAAAPSPVTNASLTRSA